jgi:hypothetical protein
MWILIEIKKWIPKKTITKPSSHKNKEYITFNKSAISKE